MRRGSHDMQVNVAGIRRNLKNLAHNYSDAQKKVREATCNDHWGPSSTIMAEIADLTYNVVAFSEIMQMIWKRLNDHGRNWRHVYKALVLLEYLIKTGSEKVAQQCKENIFAIQTLKDFQYSEEGKDQGQNVREKAKHLASLLKDDERLKNERARALKAKERFAQTACAFGSDGGLDTPTSPRYPAFRGDWNGGGSRSDMTATDIPRDIENARPQTAGEEELQLQLALAMSREEAEQEEQKRKSDDVRLQLALSQSQQDFKTTTQDKVSHMVDLLDVNLGGDSSSLGGGAVVDPWGMPQPPRPQASPWQHSSPPPSSTSVVDPWQPGGSVAAPPKIDPWGGAQPSPLHLNNNSSLMIGGGAPNRHDPWSPTSQGSSTDLDEFDVITNRNRGAEAASPPLINQNGGGVTTNGNKNGDPFELNLLGEALPAQGAGPSPSTGATKKTPQSFLGENSSLVNLDNLVTASPHRPVFNATAPKPSINEIKQQTFAPFTGGATPPQAPPTYSPQFTVAASATPFGRQVPASQDPWAPAAPPTANPWQPDSSNTTTANPFLS